MPLPCYSTVLLLLLPPLLCSCYYTTLLLLPLLLHRSSRYSSYSCDYCYETAPLNATTASMCHMIMSLLRSLLLIERILLWVPVSRP